MKTGFPFCCRPSTSWIGAIRTFYHVWKWYNVQRARSEMRNCTTYTLYLSNLWQQDLCQHPQNANPDGSTLKGTTQRIGRRFGGGGAEGNRQEDPDQGVHRNSPAANSADCQRFRRLTHNCECIYEGGIEVQLLQVSDKPDLDWEDKEPQANQVRQTSLLHRPEPAGLLRLVIRREHHQHDLPQHQSPLDRRHPPSICRAPRRRLWKRHAPSSGSVSRRGLRLKAATLNRCQLYYIIKLPELILQ